MSSQTIIVNVGHQPRQSEADQTSALLYGNTAVSAACSQPVVIDPVIHSEKSLRPHWSQQAQAAAAATLIRSNRIADCEGPLHRLRQTAQRRLDGLLCIRAHAAEQSAGVRGQP
jgi:hypothetical protein